MTQSFSASVPDAASRAAWGLGTISQPSRSKSTLWVMTMFRRRGRGLPPGKESRVLRPRMTVPSMVRERKRFMSVGRENSSPPSQPMAQFWSATTIQFIWHSPQMAMGILSSKGAGVYPSREKLAGVKS